MFRGGEKMDEAFKNHRDKRISEIRERMHNSKIKKKEEVKNFSQRLEKAWKNINEIKLN